MQSQHRSPAATSPHHGNENVYQQQAATFNLESLITFVSSVLTTPIETSQSRHAGSTRRNADTSGDTEGDNDSSESNIDLDAPQLSELFARSVSKDFAANLPLQITNLSYFDRWWISQLSSLFGFANFFGVSCTNTYSCLVGSFNRWEPIVVIVKFQFDSLWPACFGSIFFGAWIWNLLKIQATLATGGILNAQTLLILPVALCVRTLVVAFVGFANASLTPSYGTRRISSLYLSAPVLSASSQTLAPESIQIRLVGTENTHQSAQGYLYASSYKRYIDSFAFASLNIAFILALSSLFTAMSASDMTAWACGLVLFKTFPLLLADQIQRPNLLCGRVNRRRSQMLSGVQGSLVALLWKRILPQLAVVHLIDRFFVHALFPNAFLVYSTLAMAIEFMTMMREVSAIAK